jgi:hypothetical protein
MNTTARALLEALQLLAALQESKGLRPNLGSYELAVSHAEEAVKLLLRQYCGIDTSP